MDCDIGHTFIHYLYTGDYQTLKPTSGPDLPGRVVEYNRSVLAYKAAVSYGLEGLADHAKEHMQLFDDDVSIFHILALARKTFPRITDDTWFSAYLTSKIMASFEADEGIFQRDEFFEAFGEALDFDKFLAKVMVNAYSHRVSTMRDVAGPGGSRDTGTLASNDTTPEQGEFSPQPRRTNHTRDSSDVGNPLRGDDLWVACEDDGSSVQSRVLTPSSSAGDSPDDLRSDKLNNHPLDSCNARQGPSPVDNTVCPLWLNHSMSETLCRRCPKCKSHILSMFAKVLLTDAQ